MKYQIGQKIWFAHTTQKTVLTVCPDCLGNKQLKAILGDGSEIAIDCACCERGGFQGSRGTLEHNENTEIATEAVITGAALDNGREVYSGQGFWNLEVDDVFDSEAEALERAKVMAAERTAESVKRSLYKEKDTKTWAWHVTYHRRWVERARKDLEYHTAKLAYAKDKNVATQDETAVLQAAEVIR